MKIATVKRIERFNSAHRLYRKDWSDQKNLEVFGKCSNPSYHGHNYKIEVIVKGPVKEETGYVVDLKGLKQIIQENIVEPWDHRNLNLDVPEFTNINPTAENIAIVAYNKIRQDLEPGLYLKVIIQETEKNSAEYEGEVV